MKIDYEGREVAEALMNVVDQCIVAFQNIAMANKADPSGYINIFNTMVYEVERMEREIKEKQNV